MPAHENPDYLWYCPLCDSTEITVSEFGNGFGMCRSCMIKNTNQGKAVAAPVYNLKDITSMKHCLRSYRLMTQEREEIGARNEAMLTELEALRRSLRSTTANAQQVEDALERFKQSLTIQPKSFDNDTIRAKRSISL